MMRYLIIATNFFVITIADQNWTPHGNAEYFFGSALVPYDTAKANCYKMEARLAAVYNQTIQDFLETTINERAGLVDL